MKRITVLLVLLIFCFALASCEISNSDNDYPVTTWDDFGDWDDWGDQGESSDHVAIGDDEESVSDAESNNGEQQAPAEEKKSDGEWVQFLKDYEAWVDDYIAFMKKYKANPMDLTMISDYAKMMSSLTEWSNRVSEIQSTLSPEELSEFMVTYNRILSKLSNI